MRRLLDKELLCLHRLCRGFSCLFHRHASKFLAIFIDFAIFRHDVDHWQMMSLPHEVVIMVMRGGYFDSASSKGWVHMIIGDDRNMAASQWLEEHLANQMTIALILWVDSDSNISKHCLRARCGKGDGVCTVDERVAEVPERAIFFFIFHFIISKGCLGNRIPVDEIVIAVDEP